ncbi:hypothetical protein [Streptomyces microflavus]|uniref:hypothetical protein n=1 Tax=Streptomyces microflavus TaxID=1919 RepID=UPI00369A93D1
MTTKTSSMMKLGAAVVGAVTLLSMSGPANASTPAAAAAALSNELRDPSCGYLVYNQSSGQSAKVYSEAPKCGQKVRAVVVCATPSSGYRSVNGNVLSAAGYSTATCGSSFEVISYNYQINSGGSWGSLKRL